MEPVRAKFRSHYEDSAAELRAGIRVTWVGMAANVALIVLKLWGGIIGRSQALIADGIHSISDLVTDLLVIFGLRYGRQEADEDHPWGHARIETIASMIVGLLLIAVGVWIAVAALGGVYQHRESDPRLLTVIIAGLSVAIKEALYWYTVVVGRRIRSASLIGNAWHHRSDAFSSLAVLVGVAAAFYNPAWRVADSYAALVVSLFVIKVGASIGWKAFKEVVDTSPDREVMAQMTELAERVEGVREAHDVRARHSGPQILAEMHVVVDPDLTVRQGHDIAKRVEIVLLEKIPDLTSVIIHVDPDPKFRE